MAQRWRSYYHLYMTRSRVWTSLRLAILVALVIVFLGPEWPAFGDATFQFQTLVGREQRFDFVSWTASALSRKAQAAFAGTHHYLPDEVKKDFVLSYLERISAAQRLEADIERAYADPSVADPDAHTAILREERDDIRRELEWRQPLAEAIVQDQVAIILGEHGLASAGVTWPPVMMTMSPVPYMLIVSPRDRIAQVNSAALIPGLSTEDKESLEDGVLSRLDQSAIVVPIGGLGTYPAMIRETGSISRLAEVTAHEWAHHWLSFRPLGVRYLDGPAMRTMNETVASMVDREIGPLVIARFYPEFMPQETAAAAAPPAAAAAPAFDFGAQMAETRSVVDQLLADGEVEAAETYMEERRRFFVENGYSIRKLNQAYFAFYGGYAAQPGAAGSDPIGPLLLELRDASPSLKAFLIDVGRVTSYDDLLALHSLRVGAEPALQ